MNKTIMKNMIDVKKESIKVLYNRTQKNDKNIKFWLRVRGIRSMYNANDYYK